MKYPIILLLILSVTMVGCSTLYKNSQTTDDVYFSRAIPSDEYVRIEERENKYHYDDDYYDDRYLRMKVSNRNRWYALNDWYGFDRYSSRYNYFFGSYFNPYTSWNYYSNPYLSNSWYGFQPKPTTTSLNVLLPKSYNLNAYTNSNYNNSNSKKKQGILGTIIRSVYNNSNTNYYNNNNNQSTNSYTPNYTQPSRTYTPSTSSGSSSSGNSSSSGEVSRPNRGGN